MHLQLLRSPPLWHFDEPLKEMTEAWEDENLAKKSINAMIGIMSIDHNIVYTHKCSTLQDDAEEGALVSQFISGELVLYDFCLATRVLSNLSYRPVHDMCLSIEHAMVGTTVIYIKGQPADPRRVKNRCSAFSPTEAQDSRFGRSQVQRSA